jgi:hypothetical protein
MYMTDPNKTHLTLDEMAAESVLMWISVHQDAKEFGDRVKLGEPLSESESIAYRDIILNASLEDSKRIEALVKAGVIADAREFGRRKDEIENALVERLKIQQEIKTVLLALHSNLHRI